MMIDACLDIFMLVAAKQVSKQICQQQQSLFFKHESPVEYSHSAGHSLTFMLKYHDVAPSVSLLHFSSRQSYLLFL